MFLQARCPVSVRWAAHRTLSAFGLERAVRHIVYRLRFAARQPHEADFRYFARLEGDSRVFVDGGANSGQSARSFRIFNKSCPIVAFEPNHLLKDDLAFTARLLGPSFTYQMVGLSDEPTTRLLFVPVVGGVPHTQEATLNREDLTENAYARRRLAGLGGRFEIAEVRCRLIPLDALALAPAAVKLDLQGHEDVALQGMRETLRRSAPVVMVESHPRMGKIARFLGEFGYRQYVYDHRTGQLQPFSGQPFLNAFFVTQGGAI